MSPNIQTTAPATPKAKVAKRLGEAELLAKYPHMIEGTLTYDPVLNKQTVEINTIGIDGNFDGNTRRIATSDLFQVRHTVEVKDRLDAIKRNQKAKDKRKARKAEVVVMPQGSTPEERLLAQS